MRCESVKKIMPSITWLLIPSKKTALIDATYELPAPEGRTTVAVKIIDMLGEEVLVTKEID